jgi:acyl-CoA thioesterase FadM
MAGLLRNLVTLVWALLHYRTSSVGDRTQAWFLVTPFDTGIATLKSDRYLLLAECAQVDYLVRTGLVRDMLARKCSFVNAAQLVKFDRPVRVFSRVLVQTRVVRTDAKFGFFSHVFLVNGVRHAEVLVKMKFKQGRLTVAPAQFLGTVEGENADFTQLQ